MLIDRDLVISYVNDATRRLLTRREGEIRKAFARFTGERRRRIESTTGLGRVDPQETHAAERGDIDRVAIDDRSHENRVGSFKPGC